jgi:hypothetical protein
LALTNTWGNGQSAVSALLMHDTIINEFVLDNPTLSGTDWVITMPTKRYFVPVDDPSNTVDWVALRPFTETFWLNGACEPVSLSYWNREEGNVSIVDFSPPAPGGGTSLCWETNVVTFNNSHLLGAVNETNVNVDFQNGWLRMAFVTAGQSLTSNEGNTYTGLPTVGFMLQDFINQNAAPGIMATYGGNFNHKYTTAITGLNGF